METLYIIGNGFDLHHGLDTKYTSFGCFLKENHNDYYQELLKYFYLPELDSENEENFKSPLWADFENTLANLDPEEILAEFSDFAANPGNEDFRDRDWHSYQFEMERIVELFTSKLISNFRTFINAINFPEIADNNRITFKRNSIYLNFNYTDTLERYYYIKPKNINYIHNAVCNPDQQIILGHGRDLDLLKPKRMEMPEGISGEELEWWREEMANNYEYSHSSAESEIYSYFEKAAKPTSKIIESNKLFFEDLSQIKNIYVLGHSMSAVDLPYFRKITESIKLIETNWQISYYADWEIEERTKTLTDLGLNPTQFQLIKLSSLIHSNQIPLF